LLEVQHIRIDQSTARFGLTRHLQAAKNSVSTGASASGAGPWSWPRPGGIDIEPPRAFNPTGAGRAGRDDSGRLVRMLLV
jgi:hypothetical protein